MRPLKLNLRSSTFCGSAALGNVLIFYLLCFQSNKSEIFISRVNSVQRDLFVFHFIVGEPINAEAWHWYHEVVGEKRCVIVDTWWQTGKNRLSRFATEVNGNYRKLAIN